MEAPVDSGFDGGLLLPASLVHESETPVGRIRWKLADGSHTDVPVHFGRVDVAGFGSRPALISILGDAPVLGRALLDDFRVVLERGRRVVLEP